MMSMMGGGAMPSLDMDGMMSKMMGDMKMGSGMLDMKSSTGMSSKTSFSSSSSSSFSSSSMMSSDMSSMMGGMPPTTQTAEATVLLKVKDGNEYKLALNMQQFTPEDITIKSRTATSTSWPSTCSSLRPRTS